MRVALEVSSAIQTGGSVFISPTYCLKMQGENRRRDGLYIYSAGAI